MSIVEASHAYTTFDQDEHGHIDPEGIHSHGNIVGLTGQCGGCKHRWPVRNARQITELAGYDYDPGAP